jgi:tetratricopeptide (TPR) repeat protein
MSRFRYILPLVVILCVPAIGLTADIDRGLKAMKKKKYDLAIVYFTAAIRSNPKDAWAYNNRGWAYNEKGEYDRAIRDLNKAIR